MPFAMSQLAIIYFVWGQAPVFSKMTVKTTCFNRNNYVCA